MTTASDTEQPTQDELESESTSDDAALARASGTTDSAEESESELGVVSANLGVERWVIFAFLVGAFVCFMLLKNLIIAVWDRFDEPRPIIAIAVASVVAIGGAFALYNRPSVNSFANEVATEYAKVTWPTKDEAFGHTTVVIVVSLVATLILAVLDLAWSNLTNLLYR